MISIAFTTSFSGFFLFSPPGAREDRCRVSPLLLQQGPWGGEGGGEERPWGRGCRLYCWVACGNTKIPTTAILCSAVFTKIGKQKNGGRPPGIFSLHIFCDFAKLLCFGNQVSIQGNALMMHFRIRSIKGGWSFIQRCLQRRFLHAGTIWRRVTTLDRSLFLGISALLSLI